ncbi:lipopolysaccharide biosynthesis protein [Mycobacterium sp. PDNC021]|uniref:lipopolysaccharide biosynthesis protein n=1 Tax=Mycobacterium sp. PDNC021 TaxID=3391399 RepID=UPI003AAB54D2
MNPTDRLVKWRRPVVLIRAALADPMTRNSLALMVNTIGTSALGYLFWVIVARRFDATTGGTVAATMSAIQATVVVTSIGAAAALVEWLPRSTSASEWRRRVTTGMTVGGVCAGAGAVLVVALLGTGLGVLPQLAGPIGAALFVVACVLSATGQVVDSVAISDHRAGVLIGRNVLMCGLRIPLIFLPAAVIAAPDLILLAWVLAAGLAMIWATVAFGSKAGHALRFAYRGFFTHLRQMAPALVGQHTVTVTSMLAGYVLPVIVYIRLSAADNAYFYITWMLGSVFFIVSPAVAASLFVEGASRRSDLPVLARRCALTIVALLVPPVLVYIVAGRWILELFGSEYSVNGYALLLVLALSAVPDAVTNLAISVLRVTDRVRIALLLNAGMLIGCLTAAWFATPVLGILGAGVAWLLSQSMGAVWVLARWRRIVGVNAPSDGTAAGRAGAEALPLTVEETGR